jgi:glucosamine-phosphate N-acetyltransferase
MIADIREAVLSDFEEIVVLLKQLWPDKELNSSALMKVFSACLKSPDYIYMCAEIDGKVVGFCSLLIIESLWMEGLIGHINELIVEESLRRMRVGTKLLEAAIAAAKKKECKRIELDSAFFREDAHKFYEREGFTKRAYLFSKII